MRVVAALLGALALAGCWGSPVDPTPACERYVRCIRALDEASGEPTNLDRYLEEGTCWKNPTQAEGCDTSCVRALARMGRLGAPALPECAP